MILSDDAFVMLLDERRFADLTRKRRCDTTTHSEGLFALSCASRREVDALADAAVAAGGKPAMEPEDHGFMYGRSFYDPDGQHGEAFWMDPELVRSG